jgi:CRP-like cAMP-binding protein
MHLATRRAGAPIRSKADCFTCQNRERSAWCGLSNADLDLLDRNKRCTLYRPHQVIHHQGDECRGLFVIEEGTVAVRKSDAAGGSMLLRLCHPGDALGYRALLSGGVHTTEADPLVNSRVCFFERNAVKDMLRHNPELGLRFVRQLNEELETAENSMLRNTTYSIRERLVHLLVTLKDRFGSVGDDGNLSIALPLSRLDIASLLGVRPETIARTLHELESDGIVRIAGRSAIIPDLDLLLDEIEFSDQ